MKPVMGTKREELIDPRSCIGKAAPDEPIFVLRAQDKLAPVLVRMWSMLAEMHGCPVPKTREAFELADEMERWAKKNGGKYPD